MPPKDLEAKRAYARAWYARKVAEDPQFWRRYSPKKRVEKICPICGVTFQGREDKKTCSRSCASFLAKRSRPKRPENPTPWLPDPGSKAKGYINASGYRVVYRPDHPRQDRNRMILEHRVVMEAMLGRLLLPEETVHHKNGDRLDNRPENLELWTRSQPPGQRVADKVAWAKEILGLYAPEILAPDASPAA